MKKLIFIFTLLFPVLLFSQNKIDTIIVKGKVRVIETGAIPYDIIVWNKNTGNFVLGTGMGEFEILINKTDTIVVSAIGYDQKQFCFKDSSNWSIKNHIVWITKLQRNLRQVEIVEKRPVEAIQSDIKKLGVKPDPFLKSINPVESPISYLYYMYSKREKDKRLVIELENNDLMRKLLKELLGHYVEYNLIKLDNSEFDAYLDRCPINENFLKNASDYLIASRLKECFEFYKSRPYNNH